MTSAEFIYAADHIVQYRLAGRKLERFPDSWKIDGVDAAYEVQRLANRRLAEHLGAPRGLKIGGTTEIMRALINVPEPILGQIFDRTVYDDGADLRLDAYQRLGIESEIAVVLKKPLTAGEAPANRTEAAAYVGSMITAIELVDDRYVDYASIGAEVQIADNVFNAGSILGARVTEWQDLPLDLLRCRTLRDGVEVSLGTSDALMEHPLEALLFALQRWTGLGRTLPAGAFITLGTITPVQWIDAPCEMNVMIEGLGDTVVRIH